MIVSILRKLVLTGGIVLFGWCAFVNYDVLVEAYGSGLPYYSLTTNMDKWETPIPMLLVLDAFVIGVLGILIWVYLVLKETTR